MRLSRQIKKPSDDSSMIPMINVVFLLLIFFMVAGTVEPPKPLDVVPPESTQTQEPLATRVLHVSTDGSLAVDGLLVETSELVRRLKENPESDSDGKGRRSTESVSTVAANQSSSQRDRQESPPDSPSGPSLALRADAGVTFQQLKEVIALIEQAGVAEIELLTSWVPVSIEQ